MAAEPLVAQNPSAPVQPVGWLKTKALPALLLLLLVSIVVYIPNHAQFKIETGVWGMNPTNVLFGLALGVLLWMRRSSAEPTPMKGVLVALMLLLSWSLVRALAGDASMLAEDVTVWKNAVFYLLLYFLFFHAVKDLETVRILVAVILLVLLTSTYLGIRQVMDYGFGTFNETRRVAAPFGWNYSDANRSAVFFCIFMQLAASVALFSNTRLVVRLFCAALYLAGVIIVFHTFSRQSYFILIVLALTMTMRKHVVATLLCALALFNYEAWVPEAVIERVLSTTAEQTVVRRHEPSRGQPTTHAAVVSTGTLYGSVVDTGPLPSLIPEVTLPPVRPEAADSSGLDSSTESRLILWQGAADIIAEQPWGIGMNRFKQEIGGYVPRELAGKDAHNFYVLLTTEAGVAAPVVMLLVLLALLRLGRPLVAMRDDPEARVLGIAFTAATGAVAIGNFYGSRFLDGDVMGNFWILAALVARASIIKTRQRTEYAPKTAQDGRPPHAVAQHTRG